MSDALDAAKAEVARLQAESDLIDAVEAAAAAHVDDPTPENLAAHNAACEALAGHHFETRQGRQGLVGGDAVKSGE